MKRFANVCILAANLRPKRRELCVNERACQGYQSADCPRSQNRGRRMNCFGDNVRIHENARADDSTHHDHRRIEEPEPSRERSGRFVQGVVGRRDLASGIVGR